MSKVIVLDQGHGQYGNKSPNNKAYIEGTEMFKYGFILKEELEKYGFKVLLTRNKITDDPSLWNRGALAGSNGAVAFFSLHSNAPGGGNPEHITGTDVYYSVENASKNKVFADKIGRKIAEVMGHNYRGSYGKPSTNNAGQDWYGVLRGAARTGCKFAFILEHGFHTNVKDSNFLLDDNNKRKLAIAEAEIIAEYFDMKKREEIKQPVKMFEVGEIVEFLGGNHYASASATSGQVVPKSLAKITKIYNGKHSYHVVMCDKNGKTLNGGVYGWVDKTSLKKQIEEPLKVGDIVVLSRECKTYHRINKTIPNWIYNSTLYVREINGEEVIISTLRVGAITGPVHIKYLTKK